MNTPMIGFAAYSGTGKTTLLEKVIVNLKARGLRLGVLKHDAHDFDIDHEGKDSWRFQKAGADITLIASATKMALVEQRPRTFEENIASIRVMEKCGMMRQEHHDEISYRSVVHRCVYYAIKK